MKLYYSRNLNPRVAVAVAKYLRSPVEFVRANPRSASEEEAFRAINPNTLVPVLDEGWRKLWETDAIACRLSSLANSDFFPTDARLPEVLRWTSWAAHHFTRAGGTFYFENIIRPKYMKQPADAAAIEEAQADFRRFAPVLDDALARRTWLVEDQLSYADFRVAAVLPFAEPAALPVEGYANILRWHARLNDIQSWRDPFLDLT